MNNKSITKLLETVAFSNGVYVLWNLYDGNIHISIHLENTVCGGRSSQSVLRLQ